MTTNLHSDREVLHGGRKLAEAAGAVILLHGRGASAADILSLGAEFDRDDLAYLAPQAEGHTWYPYSFLAPVAKNEPWLSAALGRISEIVEDLLRAGISREKIVLAGFSQGACLAAEFVARNAGGFGGLIALSGGLIGPPGTKFEYKGRLDGMAAFLGGVDPDAHVPWERVEESAAILSAMGARVETKRYPGMPHSVNRAEIAEAKKLLDALVARDRR